MWKKVRKKERKKERKSKWLSIERKERKNELVNEMRERVNDWLCERKEMKKKNKKIWPLKEKR